MTVKIIATKLTFGTVAIINGISPINAMVGVILAELVSGQKKKKPFSRNG